MTNFPEHLADRFRRFKYRHFAPNLDHYEKLATFGQHPDVMVVSCCDSRVDKYHGVSAALEFAALNLRIKHIVVLGHSGCGGVRACLDQDAARQTEAQFISNWMSMLDAARAKVLEQHRGRPPPEIRAALEKEAIAASLANLRTFPFIKLLEGKRRLALHGAYFDIATGTLAVLNQATGAFVAV
jgi:carbonic anhydrase